MLSEKDLVRIIGPHSSTESEGAFKLQSLIQVVFHMKRLYNYSMFVNWI